MNTLSNKTRVMEVRKSVGLLALFLMAVVALSLAAVASARRADGGDDEDEIPFDEAKIFLELNDTDSDLGIHALIDGEAWRKLEIEDPNGRKILAVTGKGRLRQQGLTELFFESAEPTFDELPPDEFLARFPEGEYEISGRTLEGDELESTAVLTHVLPAPPGNISISGNVAPEDCDDGNSIPSVSDPVTIAWDAVTTSHPEIGTPTFSPDIDIVGYQVVVEREEPTLLVFSVDLPPSKTEVQVSPDFLDPDTEYKLEILVREASGNQTAVETCFATD